MQCSEKVHTAKVWSQTIGTLRTQLNHCFTTHSSSKMHCDGAMRSDDKTKRCTRLRQDDCRIQWLDVGQREVSSKRQVAKVLAPPALHDSIERVSHILDLVGRESMVTGKMSACLCGMPCKQNEHREEQYVSEKSSTSPPDGQEQRQNARDRTAQVAAPPRRPPPSGATVMTNDRVSADVSTGVVEQVPSKCM